MDHMWYPFIIMVKSSQERQGEEVTAGLCYMIICFPSVFMLLIPTVAARFMIICFISFMIICFVCFIII